MKKEQFLDLARLRSITSLCSCIIIAVGGLVLIGWIFNIPFLKSLSPNLASMKINTAISFILIGVSTLLLQTKQEFKRYRIGKLCAAIVLLLALFILSEYVVRWHFGIDELLLKDNTTASSLYPGRMSPITAILFVLLASAILLLDTVYIQIMQSLLILTCTLALLALSGYLFDVQSLYSVPPYSSIALHTTLLFLIAVAVVLFLRPDKGITAIFIRQFAGSIALRKLLPAIIGLPFFCGWLSWKGYDLGMYNSNFAFSVIVVTMMWSFFVCSFVIAISLNRLDKERQIAQQKVADLNQSLEKKIEARTSELQRMNTTKTEFLSLAAHQLRSPVTAMKWYAEMLESEEVGVLNTKQKQYIKEIHLGNQRLTELINALLNISRIELGTFVIEYVKTDVGKIMDAVVSENAVQIAAAQLTIQKKYDANYPILYTDQSLLQTVLQNILANAIAYSPTQSEIILTIETKHNAVQLSISDKGHGIPADLQSQVFEKFFRSDVSRKKRPEGSGLGLYLSYSIMQKLGGVISFYSKESIGTTFIITLPT